MQLTKEQLLAFLLAWPKAEKVRFVDAAAPNLEFTVSEYWYNGKDLVVTLEEAR